MTPRIASLVPSLTELVVALGLQPALVARTGFCTRPADAVRGIPKVGGTKDVNLDKLRRLQPTHVLVNVDENRLDTVDALRGFGAEIVVTHPCAPEDNLALIDQLAAVFADRPGVAVQAEVLKSQTRAALTATRAGTRPARKVLYLVWRDPWMTVARDTWISQLLARVDWHTLPDVHGGPAGAARYPVVRGDEPWLAAVDAVLLSSEPYAFADRDVGAARALCPQARIAPIDGELVGWYGPRLPQALEHLRALADGYDRPPWIC